MNDRAASATIDRLVDLDRYPLADRQHPARVDALERARAGLRAEGCAVLPDLLLDEGRARMAAEAVSLKHLTHYSVTAMNPYFSEADPSLPSAHPVNTFIERSSGFIPADSWPTGSPTELVYRWPPLLSFLAEALEVATMHFFADPLACLTVNVLDPGQQFTWHYDTNDFAVTLLLDEADEGGLFEYVPNIRSADHEPFEEVAAVLADRGEGVRTLDLRPGDLQIFRGRHSLHRVTRVAAHSPPRHAAIFAYTEDEGVVGRLERTHQLFGRALPAHEDAERRRIRPDALRD